MPAPQVSATPNKQNYNQGETVTITVVATDVPNDEATTRQVKIAGHDEEGNEAEVVVSIISHAPNPESFTITSATWVDTGVALQVNGMQVSGVA